MNYLIFIVAFIFIVFLFLLIYKQNKVFSLMISNLMVKEKDTYESGPPLGNYAPSFELFTPENDKITLDELIKKPTALLIVNTTCDICSLDVLEFQEASVKFHYVDFVLIISGPKELLKYERKDSHLKMFFADEKFLKDYSIKGFPTFLFISKDKKIVAKPPFVKDLTPNFKHYSFS